MTPRHIALCGMALALAGCTGGAARFTGTMTTEQGACGLGFDAAGKATATLIVQGEEVQFAPTDGVTVLRGRMTEAGHVVASSTTAGIDRKPFPIVFEADRAGDRVTGHFASPRCRAAVVLTRQ